MITDQHFPPTLINIPLPHWSTFPSHTDQHSPPNSTHEIWQQTDHLLPAFFSASLASLIPWSSERTRHSPAETASHLDEVMWLTNNYHALLWPVILHLYGNSQGYCRGATNSTYTHFPFSMPGPFTVSARLVWGFVTSLASNTSARQFKISWPSLNRERYHSLQLSCMIRMIRMIRKIRRVRVKGRAMSTVVSCRACSYFCTDCLTVSDNERPRL